MVDRVLYPQPPSNVRLSKSEGTTCTTSPSENKLHETGPALNFSIHGPSFLLDMLCTGRSCISTGRVPWDPDSRHVLARVLFQPTDQKRVVDRRWKPRVLEPFVDKAVSLMLKFPRFGSNDEAPRNIPFISPTDRVSKLTTLPLNLGAFMNIVCMFPNDAPKKTKLG